MNILSNPAAILFYPTNNLSLHTNLQNRTILFLRRSRKKNRYGFARSSKLMLESAYVIASKLGVLPAPLELILRDQFGNGGGGSGSGSGNGFGFGWGGWFFDGGGRRKRGTKLGFLGVCVLVCGLSLWLVLGEEMVMDGDVLLGGLGLVLFGLSVDGWRRGARDWVLGFCCCAFLMGMVLKRDEFGRWVRSFGTPTMRKNVLSFGKKFSSGRTRKMKLF